MALVLALRSLYKYVCLFIDTATSEIYTLSLHDALPICLYDLTLDAPPCRGRSTNPQQPYVRHVRFRSEEHTSELQSRFDLVCRLLLEKKNRPPSPPARARSSCHTLS